MIETVWGESPIRRNMDVGSATIDFLNLGDFRELQMEFHGLQQNGGGPFDVALQFSVDNGATWDVTGANYVTATDLAPSMIGVPLAGALPVLTTVAGQMEIYNWNTPWPATTIQRLGRLASNSLVKGGPTFHNTLVARNAIRLICGAAFSMNLGVLIRTRKL